MNAGALAQRGAALLGGTLARSEALEGGDLSAVLRITLADGRSAVVKGGAAPRAEAAMLAAMAASGAPVPAVLAVDDRTLVLQLLAGGSGVNGAWGDLGGILARLHATSGPRYGWDEDYAFAGAAIENGWCADWPDFWARRRLLACAPHVPTAMAARLEKLARDLPNRLPAHPTPSLLHGDLWGGNVMSAGVRITGLIDPACYYGHGEVDIAMLGMFDHPGAAFFHAYGALPPGAETRLAIYRLWPALVHLRLFGTGYRRMVETLLDEAQV